MGGTFVTTPPGRCGLVAEVQGGNGTWWRFGVLRRLGNW
jgi:hypothetical protein